ncbi:MAG: ribonuclease P protein component [Candidatus Vogelbacteria bacterium]|nr:ribonuclease P protein component [Candidatus Vogelbacteria bacterium]
MLPKVNRAGRNELDVFFSSDPAKKKVFQTTHSPLFLVKSTKTENEGSKFAFVVSSSVEKTAVGRNLIKRRARAIVARLLPNLKDGHTIMFIFKKPAVLATFDELKRDIEGVLTKLGLP